MNNGWIKFHRKILDNPIVMKDSDHLAIWAYLLLNATHEDYPALFKGKKITLKPGQLITGCISIAEHLKISESKVRRCLNDFISDGQIDRQTSNKNSLITIVNWRSYQTCDIQTDEQVTDNRQTTDEQVTDNRQTTDEQVTDNRQTTDDKQEYKNIRTEELENRRTEEVVYTDSYESVRQSDIQQIISEWNSLSDIGVKSISKLDCQSKRYKSLMARMKQYSAEDVICAIRKIRNSDFLQGKNKNGWMITFDWFVLPDNFHKVLEGNYDNSDKKIKSTGDARLDRLYNRVNEVDDW